MTDNQLKIVSAISFLAALKTLLDKE